MAKVDKFERNMIQRSLDSMGLRYLRDSDGDFVILFARDDDAGCELQARIMAVGQNHEILAVHMQSDARMESNDTGLLCRVCNLWNREHRWPKAYVDDEGDIILEEQIDLEKGIHQELLHHFIATTVAAGHRFWVWAHKDQELF